MNPLINITNDGQGSNVVSARELHTFLESKQQFADWIKNRIEKYGFVENQDFTTYSEIYEKGRPSVEYVLMLDMAKELAMVEGNTKGQQARRYFIECEKQLKNQMLQAAPVELSRKELAMLVIQAEEEKERLQKQIDQQAPKVQYADAILNTQDCVVTTVVATELGYSAVSFNKKLRTLGIQWKVDDVWVLTSKYLNKGYAQMRTHVFTDPDTSLLRTKQYMVWTQRGRAFLWWMLKGQEPPQNLQIQQGV